MGVLASASISGANEFTFFTGSIHESGYLVALSPLGAAASSKSDAIDGTIYMEISLVNFKPENANALSLASRYVLWAGYLKAGAPSSYPNLPVKRGDVIGVLVWTGSEFVSANFSITGIIQDKPVGHGWTHYEGPGEGTGFVRNIGVGMPAAGANATYTVPDGVRWMVLGITFRLKTDSTAVTRNPGVVVTDSGGGQAQSVMPGYGEGAGSDVVYSFRKGLASNTATGGFFGSAGLSYGLESGLGDLYLPAGYVLTIGAANLGTTDQIDLVSIQVIEWVVPNP